MIRSVVFLLASLFGAIALLFSTPADSVSEQARRLHFSAIVVDTHDDTTQRFFSSNFDLGKRNSTGHIDIPRMREGGLNAIFFSIWIDGRTMGPPAIQKALDQIDAVRENVRKYSKDLAFARTADDVRRAHEQGRIAVLMGIEGGHMLGNDIRMVRIYSDLGVRYMTLSHFYNDEWADSSTDKPAHNGLTDYGKGNCSRDESPGNARRYLPRFRQNVLRRPRDQHGSHDCLAFLVPRFVQSSAQHDR